MGHLNPRAKTFLGGPLEATATTAANGSATRAPHSTKAVMPSTTAPARMPAQTSTSTLTPTPTPSNSPASSDDSKTPRVAPRFGHNWATFPASQPASAGARTQRFDPNSFLSVNDPEPPYMHRSRSPSVPIVLPSDEERRHQAIKAHPNFPAGDASRRPDTSLLALRHLQLADTTPSFNPFGESSSSASTSRDATRRASPPRLTTPYAAASVSYNTRPTSRDHSPNSSDSGHEQILYASEWEESKNVYVANLPKEVTRDLLFDMGSQFGRVIYASLHHDGITVETYEMLPERVKDFKLPERFAFIMFDTVESAHKFAKVIPMVWGCECMPANETHQLKGKVHEDPHSSNLYVAEIPLNCTEQDLHNLMHPGIISSHRFLIDSSGNRRGVAMVRLQSRAQAEAAIARLDRKITMRGCVKPIQVRIADSESQKLYKKGASGAATPPPLRRAASVATMQTPAQPTYLAAFSADLVYQELTEGELQTAVEIGVGAGRELRRRESMRALNARASVPSLAAASTRQNLVAFPEMPMTPTTPTYFGAAPQADPWVFLPTSTTATSAARDAPGRWERDNGSKSMYTPDSEGSSSSSSSRGASAGSTALWNDRRGASSSWRN
ncbi:hypothetical protein Q8F55_002664 [Vanrija albida]|uniref:RRM domain-containing protein n=1 Tax=Vanrija albida TaxID=181172 RepID=A0ABR3QAE5_9TREE